MCDPTASTTETYIKIITNMTNKDDKQFNK